MILCIESWKGDTCLFCKSLPPGVLKARLRAAEALCDPGEDNFIPLLIRMYGWEPVSPPESCIPDCTWDRDTGLLLSHQD